MKDSGPIILLLIGAGVAYYLWSQSQSVQSSPSGGSAGAASLIAAAGNSADVSTGILSPPTLNIPAPASPSLSGLGCGMGCDELGGAW